MTRNPAESAPLIEIYDADTPKFEEWDFHFPLLEF